MMILLFLISGAFAGALFRTIKEVMNLKKEIRLSLIEVGFILLFSINSNLLFCAVYRNI